MAKSCAATGALVVSLAWVYYAVQILLLGASSPDYVYAYGGLVPLRIIVESGMKRERRLVRAERR